MQNKLSDLDNEQLLQKIKSGDKFAYKLLFEKYYSQLTRFALLYVKDRDISEEIIQELFVQFWIKKETINISTSIKSYLHRAVRNRALNYLRDKKNHLSIDVGLQDIINIGNEDVYDIDYIELKKFITLAIESLPEKCKNIYKMSRFEEMSYKQIAESLNISAKTVENQIGIALRKLREKLQPVIKSLIAILIQILIA